MAMTEADIEEFIRALQGSAELRERVRGVILADDFLVLPGLVRASTEAIAALTERIDRLTGRMDAFEAQMENFGGRMGKSRGNFSKQSSLVILHRTSIRDSGDPELSTSIQTRPSIKALAVWASQPRK